MISDICWEESQGRPCIVSVDMFGGEHTETARERKYANLQPGHTIGPKVTAKMQVTDIRFSKLGKDAARAEQVKVRTAQRRKADAKGEAPNLTSRCLEVMMIGVAMHKACEKDNRENESVILAFRMAGYLSHIPTPTGLRKAEGDFWDRFEHLSGRIAKETGDRRYEWVSEEGVPEKPDWTELKRLRDGLKAKAAKAAEEALAESKAEAELKLEADAAKTKELNEVQAALEDEKAEGFSEIFAGLGMGDGPEALEDC